MDSEQEIVKERKDREKDSEQGNGQIKKRIVNTGRDN